MHLEWPINRSVGKGSLHTQIINPTNNPKMKAIVVICILASLLLSSPSIIVARELADRDASIDAGSSVGTKNPNKPGISCGRPSDPKYSSCVGKPKPSKCDPKSKAYGRCKPPQGP